MHLSLAFFQRSLHIFHFLPMFELYTYILSYIVVESVMVTFFLHYLFMSLIKEAMLEE